MPAFPLTAIALFVCLLTGIVSEARDSIPNGKQEPEWSKAVNDLQGRIVLKRVQVFNGTAIIATYLHLRNPSDGLNNLSIPWDGNLIRFRVVDPKGNEVPKAKDFSFDGAVLEGTVD